MLLPVLLELDSKAGNNGFTNWTIEPFFKQFLEVAATSTTLASTTLYINTFIVISNVIPVCINRFTGAWNRRRHNIGAAETVKFTITSQIS